MSGYRTDARYDFNGPRPQGVAGFYQKALVDDREQTPLAAFVDPLRAETRLTLVPVTRVLRVALDGTQATGVDVLRDGNRETIAGGQVVVAANPVRSAQLLMLSGIGPAAALGSLAIPVVADLPGVGANLHDHVRVPIRWSSPKPFGASTVTAGLFTVSLAAAPPDLQMDFALENGARPALGMDITLVRPRSRGAVTLASADPSVEPRIEVAALADEADAVALARGLQLARLIVTTSVLDPLRGDETPATGGREATSELAVAVRAIAARCGHLAGTCAMGPETDANAVVDAALRVRGVHGLRVAGTAIMPDIVNAPPLAAAAMIGGRAAQLLDA
jgi:choline dehydrogenase